jgi:effector-binding domain-containing protein
VSELFHTLEAYVRKHAARAERPPLTLIDADVTVAVPVTWELPAADGIATQLLPAVPAMACAVHNGSYGGLARRLQQMLRWLDETGRRPCGPIREVYLRFGAEASLALPRAYLADGAADYVTELQVPVTAGTPPSE